MTRTDLIYELPGCEVVELNGGFNIYKDGRCAITAYFGKSNKYCITKLNKWVKFHQNFDSQKLDEIKSVLFPKKIIAEFKGTGAQECIDHITRKITTIENTKPNAICLTVLKSLTKELEQYL